MFTARQAGQDLSFTGAVARASSVAIRVTGCRFGAEARAASALANAGLAALVALPCLLIASLISGAPLAGAAAIALLLVPVFASAPTFADRLATAGGGVPNVGGSKAAAAVERLDRSARSEAVLFVERSGAMVAATRAARSLLGIEAEENVAQSFALIDRAAILNAMATCQQGAGSFERTLELAGRSEISESVAVTFEAVEPDMLELRCRLIPRTPRSTAPEGTSRIMRAVGPANPSLGQPASTCDTGDSLTFATRQVRPKAEAKGVALSLNVAGVLEVACDRQDLRRVLYQLLLCAVDRSEAPGIVWVSGSRLGAAISLRITFEPDRLDSRPWRGRTQTLANVQAMVDAFGGGLIIEDAAAESTSNIRLVLPVPQQGSDNERSAGVS